MATWQQLADELKTDPVLEKLDEKQVESLIDVLMLVMHADEKVAFMEEAEFDHLIYELPWVESKHDKIEAHIKTTRTRLGSVDGEADYRKLVSDATKLLVSPDVRVKTYRMAVTLAEADMELHPDEHKVLTWLAEDFGIPEAQRQIRA